MTKPGFKTTEFWLSLVAMIVGALVASGAFADTSTIGKALAVAGSILAGLGYTASRAWVKGVESKADAVKALADPTRAPTETEP